MTSETDFSTKRVLIFVVAYNAETTISSVLDRIPEILRTDNVEVLVIDDFSKDATFQTGLAFENRYPNFRITMLRTPENQGYGGNQKLGYHYAIDHGFDIVALLHGDGQYAPEKLPMLLEPFYRGEAEAVFGSRMIHKKDALKGGMPLYKWLGNQTLTSFQNKMLGTHLSEFHSGYRLYSVDALRQIPFERNSNNFHFDSEIIVQFILKKLRIVELPIPTFYGDEICHVNGLKYAWDVFKTMLRASFHQRGLLYDRKFDVLPGEETYDLKIGFPSSHTAAIDLARDGAAILDIGCGRGYVAREFARKARKVTGIDQFEPDVPSQPNLEFFDWDLDAEHIPVDVSEYDQIFMLDIIEHLRDPEAFMEKLRHATGRNRPEIILTTANIAFVVTRLMLFLGQFNYGRKGILDRTHTRMFTFRSLRELLAQAGYKICQISGIPAPFSKAIGNNWVARLLVRINQLLITIAPGVFSYQVFIRAQANPAVHHLLLETLDSSEALKRPAGVS